ncbi:MAG: DUF3014 domain-containing protein [Nevskia sp.]|nr:DUF3014 domain-containing protein [Nevskia sp.]
MNRTAWTALGIAVLAAIGAYLYFRPAVPTGPAPPPPAEPAPAPPAAPPESHYQIPEPPPAAAPAAPAALDDSDSQMRQALEQLLGAPAAAMLTPKNLVRRIVATVDSLDRAPIPVRLRAVGAVPGQLAVDGSGGAITLSPRNAQRYDVLIAGLRATDGARIGALYRSHYAWFQQAYEDLGYPGRYFNDRLVHVINHLLATPEVPYPVALAQSGTLYTYADPALESLSSGQKILIRMGPDNAAVVKARLREIRRAVTNQP